MTERVSSWTEEEDTVLKEKWMTHSAGLLAQMLNKTRNAIIGRANRLKMRKGHAAITEKIQVVREKKPRKAKSKTKGCSEDKRLPPAKEIKLNIEFLDGIGVPIWDLQAHHCRYVDEPSSLKFCGHQVKAGSSYCFAHHQYMYVEKKND